VEAGQIVKTVFTIIERMCAKRINRYARLPMAAILIILMLLTFDVSASILISEEGISPTRSAEYVRTQSRNASTDADAIHYNPAGLSFMLNGGILYLFRKWLGSYENCAIIEITLETVNSQARQALFC
jgi:hypothetical protein